MKNQRFGVELEFTGITRQKAAIVVASVLGGPVRTFTTRDQLGRKWTIAYDSSILPQMKKGGAWVEADADYQAELVTPILTYNDIPLLQEVVRALRGAGARVNWSCGIHIHIDAANHDAKTVRNLVNIIASREDILYQALQVNNNRVRYCQKVKVEIVDAVNSAKPKNMEGIGDIWYKGYAAAERAKHYSKTRYYGLNLHALWDKGTIEFRMFNSTLHAGEVKAYIQLALAISHQALTQKSARPVKPSAENPKYTFRCWLLRLGMIGEEFATARHHLLKNLPGNAAWRHPEAI